MSLRAACSVIFVVSIAACQAETFTSPGPTGLEILHSPPPQVSLGTELDTLLLVRVVDEAGHSLAGVAVSWQVIDGDGEIIPTDSISGVDGLASARWKFRMIPGLQRAQVKVASLDPVTFSTEAQGFRAVQVTAGWSHGCGLDADEVPWCWGGDSLALGEVSVGRYTLRPTRVSGGHHFTQIQAGSSFTCGLTSAGAAWCWGYNWGNAFTMTPIVGSATPLQIDGLPALIRIRAGDSHACGIAADSTTWCWGSDAYGQAGGSASSVPATQVGTGLAFIDLALGTRHSCGLTENGAAYCWGDDQAGQLGDSGATRNAPTTAVVGGHQFVQIAAGDESTCGLTLAREVWCWGANIQTGADKEPVPHRVDLPSATSLSVGFSHIAITSIGGQVYFAPLTFSTDILPSPIQDQGVSQFAGRASYCMVGRSGDVYCSGEVVDQINCSSLPPWGCAPTGPIPMPTGGRVYGYPPFGD